MHEFLRENFIREIPYTQSLIHQVLHGSWPVDDSRVSTRDLQSLILDIL